MGFSAFWTHVGCKGNIRTRWSEKTCKSQAEGESFTSFLSVFATSRKAYFALKRIGYVVYRLLHLVHCCFPDADHMPIVPSARAYVRINYEDMRRKGKFPKEHRVICQYRPRGDTVGKSPIEISSSAREYVRINYKEKRKIPQRASRDLPIQTTWWSPREQFPWNFIFCTCICTHIDWEKDALWNELNVHKRLTLSPSAILIFIESVGHFTDDKPELPA